MRTKKHIYCEHISEYEIAFFDVDSMEIMWHGNYVKYLELARCAFLEEIGYTYDVMKENGFSYPIVQLYIKYVLPALFRQKIRIKTLLIEYETSIRFDYVIEDLETGEKLTKAETMQVAIALKNRETQLQTPKSWQSAVENYRYFNPLENA